MAPSKDFPIHDFTVKNSVYRLENVASLERPGGIVVVAPAKQGGSGGPVRVFVLLKAAAE
jgi:kynurenine formamidase